MSNELQVAAIAASMLSLLCIAVGLFWVVVLVLGFVAGWGGDVVNAWRWRQMRRKCRGSVAYDDLL